MKRMVKPFYLASIVGASVFGSILLAVNPPSSLVLLVYSFVVTLVFWYNSWRAIQDGTTRPGPGTAVGLLFVPVLNLFWAFWMPPAYARRHNSYRLRHSIPGAVFSPGLFLLWPVFNVLGIVSALFSPTLSVLMVLAGIAIQALVVSSVCDSVNELLGPAGLQTNSQPASEWRSS